MPERPEEPQPTKLPTLDTSAVRKPIKLTQTSGAAQSRGHADLPLPEDTKKRLKRWNNVSYLSLTCVAGAALLLGGPIWALLAVPLVGWPLTRVWRARARNTQTLEPLAQIHSPAGQELLRRVQATRKAVESLALNDQIAGDLLLSLDALPERIRVLDVAENQCQALLKSLPDTDELADQKTKIQARLAQLGQSRKEIGKALDTLSLQSAQVAEDTGQGRELEQRLHQQAQALAKTSKDLT